MPTKQQGPGRPPLREEGPATEIVAMRVTPDQKARYYAAAEAYGVPFARWASIVLDRQADQDLAE